MMATTRTGWQDFGTPAEENDRQNFWGNGPAPEKERARPLCGMKAICAYMGKSENTIRGYIRKEGLPAGKIGGEWVSDEGRIDDWRLRRIG